jgi:AbrB family looped-hinge helix DNA binding protein
MPFAIWHKPSDNGIVKDIVTLDKAGRIILPKPLRDELHLSPGDTLDLSVEGEQVTLRPRRSFSPLQRKQGVWVFSTGKPMTSDETAEVLRKVREQRDRHNAGETK